MRAAALLFAAIVAGGRAAAQRVIRGYGANEDFANQALAAGGYPQPGYDAYPQQRSGGNYGGGFLEFMLGGGNRSPAGYDASYSRGAVRYNDPSYRQAAYGPAGAFEAPVQRGMWSGVKQVSRKAEWPAWTPPPEMLRRRPNLPRHMEGGPANPLGARRTLPWLIALPHPRHQRAEHDRPKRVVCCIRMMNEDVTDLYGRLGIGTKVVVM
jgi:hypothetical protein